MPSSSFTRFYERADFVALVTPTVPLATITTALVSLSLTLPIRDVRQSVTGDGIVVEWESAPSAPDIAAVDATVAAFVGTATTSAPFEYNSFGASTTTSGTHQTKLDNTTPALDAGTYQVIWSSSIRMQAVIANTGIEGKIRVTRSDGVFVEQTDAWDLNVNHAYNGALTFQILAGQTIRTHLTFARLGASGTAEMGGVRITVDKIS